MNKAYGLLELKSVDDEKRTIEGIASTITPDRVDDIVEPKGAVYNLPIPLLSQHSHHLPIGEINSVKTGASEIAIKATIAKNTGLQYLEDAWKQIKAGLVRGLSIGFQPLEYSIIDKTGGLHIKRWSWFELSAVTIPANVEAKITSVKQCYVEHDMLDDLRNAAKVADVRKRLGLSAGDRSLTPSSDEETAPATSGSNHPAVIRALKDLAEIQRFLEDKWK